MARRWVWGRLRVWGRGPVAAAPVGQPAVPGAELRRTNPMRVSSEQVLVHVRSVDLHVADGAILELRAEQVVKRGRHSTQCGRILDGSWRRGQVGVTLQAHVADFRAD